LRRLDDYREIIGDKRLGEIYKKVRNLYGAHIVHINSTSQGGGVAEMLSSLVPLMNDVGIDAGWRVLHGNVDFFSITKSFHNGLQGEEIHLTDIKKEIYMQTNENFSTYTHLNHDCIIVHDPQPLPMIQYYRKRQPWIWRCHIDLSKPDGKLWYFLKKFMLRYDMKIISNKAFIQPDLPIDKKIIFPAINPLSPKNKELDQETIDHFIKKFEIPTDKPIVTQISRFDKWKDPEGVLKIYKKVKEEFDCRLVLCGSMASDDPEGADIYSRIRENVEDYVEDREIILLTVENNILVNVLQRISAVIIQKSIREGFGLTVSEALWKGTPVVASRVGGIPLQIQDGVNGYLLEPDDYDGFANKIVEILKNPKIRDQVGKAGRETVKEKFLITRLLGDYLDVFQEMLL
jgi:trehalose synthase